MNGRVGITLSARLLALQDDDVRRGRHSSCSAAVEAAIAGHYAQRADDRVREATIAYYRSLSPQQRAGDEAIARASCDALAAVLVAEDRRARRNPPRVRLP